MDETTKAVGLVFWHWFVLAAALGTLEILTPGVFFLWLGVAALCTGVIVSVFPFMASSVQLIIYAVLSVIMVLVAWKFMKRNPIKSEQPLLNLRSAQYVGNTYTLVDAIKDGSGRIKLGDSTWKVEGPDAPVGSVVKVVAFHGATLNVEIVSKGADITASVEQTKTEESLQKSLKDPMDQK